MDAGKRQQAIRAMRGQMWSPGRPSRARREDRVRFWEAIARGASSKEAAVGTGVPQAVGTGRAAAQRPSDAAASSTRLTSTLPAPGQQLFRARSATIAVHRPGRPKQIPGPVSGPSRHLAWPRQHLASRGGAPQRPGGVHGRRPTASHGQPSLRPCSAHSVLGHHHHVITADAK
jgi:hypothetical protein